MPTQKESAVRSRFSASTRSWGRPATRLDAIESWREMIQTATPMAAEGFVEIYTGHYLENIDPKRRISHPEDFVRLL